MFASAVCLWIDAWHSQLCLLFPYNYLDLWLGQGPSCFAAGTLSAVQNFNFVGIGAHDMGMLQQFEGESNSNRGTSAQ